MISYENCVPTHYYQNSILLSENTFKEFVRKVFNSTKKLAAIDVNRLYHNKFIAPGILRGLCRVKELVRRPEMFMYM